MRRFLSTPDSAAFFDFLGNYVQLTRIDTADKPRVHQWWNDRSVFAKGGAAAEAAREDKADLVHETTHFLDATTTIWGLEYQYRKSLVSEALMAEQNLGPTMDVFMLNTAEIDSHHALMKQHETARLTDCDMRHTVRQDDFFGPLITVHFKLGGRTIQEVPLSMLSVLEANAVANEMLSKIYDCELIEDEDERHISFAHIEQDFKNHLDDQERSEYTVFLHLITRASKGRRLKDQLQLTARLVRLVLDLGTSHMAMMALPLEGTFLNISGGAAVTMDMRRGGSRPAALFKLILQLDGSLTSVDEDERERLLQDYQDHPEDLFLGVTGTHFDRGWIMYEVELNNSERRLGGDYGLLDHVIVPASLARNRAIAIAGDYAANFFDFGLVDPLTDSGDALELPNRLNIDIASLLDDKMRMLGRLDTLYRETRPARFFIAF